MTPIYRLTPDLNYVVQQPTMNQPNKMSAHRLEFLSDDDKSTYRMQVDKYNRHIASLKSFPASGFNNSYLGKDLIRNKDFIVLPNIWAKESGQYIAVPDQYNEIEDLKVKLYMANKRIEELEKSNP